MAGAVEELLKKRGELTERRRTLEQEIKQIDSDLAAIDQVARLFDPSILPTITSRKKLPAGSNPLTGENLSAIALKTIREAKESISTAACSSAIARDKGLAEDDPFFKAMPSRISATLSNLEKRGRVRQAGTVDGRKNLWEIAR
ncbi:hypothetical protein [Microvirga puerhi]|uniref:HTH HARE-type domain-containing protein n=1 Tax=Microvirga puerhi TaxID=2876078 RepID=A0ABS7VVY9_9HYPH|nr:hypothetical protein [Microvirga puerhi]MBZ6079028.1 hypothetical protein [Microvirga puerhi]